MARLKLKPPGVSRALATGRGGVRSRRRLKAVAVLPTLLTLGNLVCGVLAVHICLGAFFNAGLGTDPLQTRFVEHRVLGRILPSVLATAGYLVFLAMLLDMLDGSVARWARRSSGFGAQLDSLADMVSFGLAPAVLTLTLLTRQVGAEWVIAPLGDPAGRATLLASVIYVCAAALRLARFNVETGLSAAPQRYFKGLPTPGAAAALASLVLVHESVLRSSTLGIDTRSAWVADWLVRILPVVMALLGVLMVSRLPYLHVPNALLRSRRPVWQVFTFLLATGVVIWWHELGFAAVACVYALSGPVVGATWRVRHRRASATEVAPGPAGGDDRPRAGQVAATHAHETARQTRSPASL